MKEMTFLALAAVLTFTSEASAGVKTGTFVCESVQAVGFKRSDDHATWLAKDTDTWRPLSFILTIESDPNTDAGYETNLVNLSQGPRLIAYRITVAPKGLVGPMECKDTVLTDAKKGVNRFVFYSGTNAEFGCKADHNYQVNLETMRFTTTTPVGYIWGDNQQISGPVTYIGECKAF